MEVCGEPIRLRSLETGDIGWLVQRHAELYAAHDGFDATFELLVAEILVAFAREHDGARERGWIAVGNGRRLGSIFCVRTEEPGTAKLRLFFVEPKARGLGLGQHLLDTCVRFAEERGYKRMRLWTHESHRAACSLYAKNGFACVDSRPVRSFGQDLVEQTWERELHSAPLQSRQPGATTSAGPP